MKHSIKLFQIVTLESATDSKIVTDKVVLIWTNGRFKTEKYGWMDYSNIVFKPS